MRFHLKSFITSVVLFLILAFIAIYVRDQFIRPFLGDVLVVIWLYFCFKTVLRLSVLPLAIGTLFVAYLVEFAQYFKLIYLLGLEDVTAIRIIFGATFDVLDLLAYTLGFLIILYSSYLKKLLR